MTTRYEVVLEDGDRFFFQLRGADGEVVLRSRASKSKIMTQNAILHLRSALRDEGRIQTRQGNGGHYLEIADRDGSILAISRAVEKADHLPPVITSIQEAAGAPMVDLTKRRQQAG